MNTKTTILTVVAVAVVLAAGASFYFADPAAAPSPAPSDAQPAMMEYALADVAMHATAADCWTIVRGNVYDLTSWIASHPGGPQAILQMCGIDGTEVFVGQHGGMSAPEDALANFKIGVYAQ